MLPCGWAGVNSCATYPPVQVVAVAIGPLLDVDVDVDVDGDGDGDVAVNRWLGEPLRYSPFPAAWSRVEIERAYADDAALARNFFKLPQASLELIQEGLHAKARHTFEKVAGVRRKPELPRVAAAGAR